MGCNCPEPLPQRWWRDPAALRVVVENHGKSPTLASRAHGPAANTISKAWNSMGFEELQRGPTAKPIAANREDEIAVDVDRLDDINAMLKSRGLEPAEWAVIRCVVNSWDSVSEGSPLPLKQLKVTLRPRLSVALAVPASDVKPIAAPKQPDKGKPRLVVFVGDEQAPYHDEQLHRLFLRWLAHNQPQEAVHLGDLLDLPNAEQASHEPGLERQRPRLRQRRLFDPPRLPRSITRHPLARTPRKPRRALEGLPTFARSRPLRRHRGGDRGRTTGRALPPIAPPPRRSRHPMARQRQRLRTRTNRHQQRPRRPPRLHHRSQQRTQDGRQARAQRRRRPHAPPSHHLRNRATQEGDTDHVLRRSGLHVQNRRRTRLRRQRQLAKRLGNRDGVARRIIQRRPRDVPQRGRHLARPAVLMTSWYPRRGDSRSQERAAGRRAARPPRETTYVASTSGLTDSPLHHLFSAAPANRGLPCSARHTASAGGGPSRMLAQRSRLDTSIHGGDSTD